MELFVLINRAPVNAVVFLLPRIRIQDGRLGAGIGVTFVLVNFYSVVSFS